MFIRFFVGVGVKTFGKSDYDGVILSFIKDHYCSIFS